MFFLVEDNDMSADDRGDTLADDLADISRWASLSIVMYSGSCPKGSPGTGVVRRGDWGREKTPENSLDRSTQEPHLELEEVGGVSMVLDLILDCFCNVDTDGSDALGRGTVTLLLCDVTSEITTYLPSILL